MENTQQRWIMRIKGRREPVELTRVQADGVKRLMNTANETGRHSVLDVAGFTGKTDRVVSVEPMEKRDANENDEDTAKAHKREANAKLMGDITDEYRLERSKRLAMAPFERGMSLGVASLVWWAYTGTQSLPENVAKEIIEKQQEWFEANPTHTQANPGCYKAILNAHRIPAKDQRENDLRGAAMGLVERVLARDLMYA